MEKKMNQKVSLLFQAVLELIEEGMDIHTMKVIDITNRAGIGKGTAYEYFKSKEELVAEAIFWDMEQRLLVLKERLDGCQGFQSQIFEIFQWMDENLQKKRSKTLFFKIVSQSYEIANGVCKQCKRKNGEILLMFQEFLERIRSQGISEKLIRPDLETGLVDMALISACVSYFLYLNHEEVSVEASSRKVQEFLYHNLRKSLGACYFPEEMV